MKIIKQFFVLILLVGLLFLFPDPAASQSCGSKDECQKLISEYEQKLSTLREQKNTLSSQIQFMDTQIYLTTLQIQAIERNVVELEKEIENLTGRIEGLDSSLTQLSKLLVEKIAEGYKRRETPLFEIILDSDDASVLMNRLKYAKVAEENDRRVAFQLQQAKANFEEQKQQREEKKQELARLEAQLDAKQTELNTQKAGKQKLLADTQNDETTYQNLIARARAQMSAFSSFARSSGAFSVISNPGGGSDGYYFSQRDSRWANQNIGNSTSDCDGHGCSVLEAGCLISSVAMVYNKQRGGGLDPSAIASNLDYFSANTAYMKFGTPAGNRRRISVGEVDSYLSQGRYVIAGINYGGCQSYSDHFVVLTKKEGSDYKMHDPIYGPDLNFSSHYSQVCWAEVLD